MNLIKPAYFLSILSSLFFPGLLCATTFSPYVDLTLNVHWSNSSQSLEPVDLVGVSKASQIQRFHLAFITDAGHCEPAWGSQMTYSVSNQWGMKLTNDLKKANIPYIISLGGANGNDLSMNCDKANLVKAYDQIITLYQPEGLDFDIENGTANLSILMNALEEIQRKHPNLSISFTLPVMPEGLTFQGQDILKQAQEHGLNYSVNIMAMDYGPSYLGDMGDYAITAGKNLYIFLKSLYPSKNEQDLWNMIEITPMIGVNDVRSELFTLEHADALAQFAQKQGIKGISMWSISRDNPCADEWTSSLCSGKNLQAYAYEFSHHFMHLMT